MNEPKKIVAGTSVGWSFSHDLALSGWQFTYILRGSGSIDIATATEVVSGVVSVSELPSVTSSWVVGDYEWRLFAESGDDKHLVSSGRLYVDPDFSKVGAGHDPRTHAEKMLAAIKEVLEGRIPKDCERYTVDDRSLDRIPILELERLKRIYVLKVRKERKDSNFNVRRVVSRFSE